MNDRHNGSAFSQGADRLEQVARSLKSQQIEERQGTTLQVASSRLMAVSPDEAWARQFSSQCIGPVCFKMAPGSDMKLPPLTQAIQSSPPGGHASAFASAAQAPAKAAAASAKPLPMGAVIGKPARRGFFGRLFRPA